MSKLRDLINQITGMPQELTPSPIEAQATAARLAADGSSVATVIFPISHDRALTLITGIQAVIEALGADPSSCELAARWLNVKVGSVNTIYPNQSYGEAKMPSPLKKPVHPAQSVGPGSIFDRIFDHGT